MGAVEKLSLRSFEPLYELDVEYSTPQTEVQREIARIRGEVDDYFSYSNKVLPNILRCQVDARGNGKLVDFDISNMNSLEKTYFNMLEKFPDCLQKILNDGGAGVVFSHGSVTAIPGLEYLKEQVPRGWPENYSFYNIRGITFEPDDEKPFKYLVALGVGENFNYIGGCKIGKKKNVLSLHEFAHPSDTILGKHFFGIDLSKFQPVLDLMKKEKIHKAYFEHPEEFVAEAFQSYYFSGAVRKEFIKDWPKMNVLIQAIEIMAYRKSKGKGIEDILELIK